MVTPPPGWLAVSLAVAGVQLAAAARLLWRSRRPAKRDNAPSACVIVPFKGRTYPDNIKAFLSQEYPGPLSWRFVVADERDPIVSMLPREHLVVSGAVPEKASEKCLNLLAGVAASGDAELLLFADADVKVGPHWARHLASALLDSGATIATAALLPAHEGGPSLLRAAWLAAGLSWFEPLGIGVGQSLALRRRDFETLDVARLWSRAVSDDLSLSNAVRAAGGRSVLVPVAAPEGRGGSWSQSVAQFTKWMTLFRYEMPHVWWPGLAAVLIKLGAIWQSLTSPFCPALLGVVLLGDALTLFIAVTALDSWRRALAVALVAPLLLACHAWNYLASAFHREIVWSGWTYSLDDSRAERGSVPALYARRARLLRLLAAALAAFASGAAFWPGAWGLLAWAGFVPLLLLLPGQTPWQAFGWGLGFGAARYLVALPWLHGFVSGFLGAGAPEAWVWCAGVALTQSLRWGALAALAAASPRGGLLLFLGFGALFDQVWPALLAEPLAYTQLFAPDFLLCIRLWGGQPAFILLAANALPAALLRREKAQSLALAGLLAAALVTGRVLTPVFAAEPPDGGSQRVLAVQSGGAPWLERQKIALTPSAGPRDLIVFGEGLRPSVGPAVDELGTEALRRADGSTRNVAVLMRADGARLEAEKVTLVPFGEYMPGGPLRSLLRRLSPRTQQLTAGAASGPLTLSSGARAGTLVCYENLDRRRSRRLRGQGAAFFTVQASGAWTDDALAAEQHARFGALRAVETGRALLHVSDAGPSVLYGRDGRELARLARGAVGRLAVDVPLPEPR